MFMQAAARRARYRDEIRSEILSAARQIFVRQGFENFSMRTLARAVGYSPAAAQITVLESWIYATSSQEALWAIERVSLAWQDGDWRVTAIAGAAPSANESLADLRAQLGFPGTGDASVR